MNVLIHLDTSPDSTRHSATSASFCNGWQHWHLEIYSPTLKAASGPSHQHHEWCSAGPACCVWQQARDTSNRGDCSQRAEPRRQSGIEVKVSRHAGEDRVDLFGQDIR